MTAAEALRLLDRVHDRALLLASHVACRRPDLVGEVPRLNALVLVYCDACCLMADHLQDPAWGGEAACEFAARICFEYVRTKKPYPACLVCDDDMDSFEGRPLLDSYLPIGLEGDLLVLVRDDLADVALVCDLFRDAELLAEALGRKIRGARVTPAAVAAYWRRSR